MRKKKTKRNITQADKDAGKRAEAIFKQKGKALGYDTQEKLGDAVGGITQGAVSQYFNGDIGWNLPITLKFANALQVLPTEIRPDLADTLPSDAASATFKGDLKVWLEAEEFVDQIIKAFNKKDVKIDDLNRVQAIADSYNDLIKGNLPTQADIAATLVSKQQG